MILAVAGVAIAIVVTKKTGTSAVVTTAPSASSSAAASQSFKAAYDTLENNITTDSNQANTALQTDGDPTAGADAIKLEAQHVATFGSTVGSIQFPTSDRADAKQVISTASALATGLDNLSINTTTATGYDTALAAVTPLRAAFQAACTTLGSDLGLTG
jgi:hypothetical protein